VVPPIEGRGWQNAVSKWARVRPAPKKLPPGPTSAWAGGATSSSSTTTGRSGSPIIRGISACGTVLSNEARKQAAPSRPAT
jgi:hypothetical protein